MKQVTVLLKRTRSGLDNRITSQIRNRNITTSQHKHDGDKKELLPFLLDHFHWSQHRFLPSSSGPYQETARELAAGHGDMQLGTAQVPHIPQ